MGLLQSCTEPSTYTPRKSALYSTRTRNSLDGFCYHQRVCFHNAEIFIQPQSFSNYHSATRFPDNSSAVLLRSHLLSKIQEITQRHRNLEDDRFGLTLNVRGPSYLGLTRSISWLLMPWLLTSPGHQQPCYWLCRIGMFLSYLRKEFNYLRRINVEEWDKMKIYVYFPSEKFST